MTHPYGTLSYAETVAGDQADLVAVSEWDQWLTRRPVAFTADSQTADVAGCYPVSVFNGQSDLTGGLERLRTMGFVSVVFVADPVLRPDEKSLSGAFELCRPFKTHYLHDAGKGAPLYSKHHRYELRRARADVRQIALVDHMPAWRRLYQSLSDRHGIIGPAAFSLEALHSLARLDGLVAFGAFAEDELVACHLWIRAGAHVHSHMAASNQTGRNCGAGYLLYDVAIRHFDDAETIDFGGAAGLTDDPNSGLARFKRGFSNSALPAFLCGQVLDRARYRSLCKAAGVGADDCYFPAYRNPLRCGLKETKA